MQKIERKLENINFSNRTGIRNKDSILLNGTSMVNFSSNDYLGLSKNKKLISSSLKWTKLYGTSFSSSRLVSGNFDKINYLEDSISKNVNCEKTLILGSGFLLNSTLIPALTDNNIGQRNEILIFSDKYNHSSINFGSFLTKQKIIRYKHLDLNHLEFLLKKSNNKIPKIIITETLFSMDGDIVDIEGVRFLAQKFNSFLYIDEAHSMGVLGKNGFGIASNLYNENEVIIGTFGKSFGSYGGFVSSSKKIYDKIICTCSGLIYSSALPPGNYAAISEAIKIVPTLKNTRKKLLENSRFLIKELNKIDINTGSSNSQIIPIILGDETKCFELQSFLRKNGFFVKVIRSPTVPKGSERIRVSLTATMSKKIINNFLNLIKKFQEI